MSAYGSSRASGATPTYEVLASLPGETQLPAAVNGHPWQGPEPLPNVVVFRAFQTFPEQDFLPLVHRLRGAAEYRTGPRYEARYLPFNADTLVAELLRSR